MFNGYFFDYAYANIKYFYNKIANNKILSKSKTIFNYRKNFKNWVQIIFYRAIRKFPFKVITRDGIKVIIRNKKEWEFFPFWINSKLIKEKFGIEIKHLEKGDFKAIFKEDYKFLVDRGNYVLDIGANIGDTALYFWRYGMKVIGFEIYPVLYKIAKENIRINKAKEIKIIRAGIGKEDKIIIIENNKDAKANSDIKISKKGIKTKIYSLKSVIKKFKIPKDSNLKIDCEGCEYDIILNCDNKTLRHFKKIQIEYHYGRKNLVEKLKKAGFKVKSNMPYKKLNSWNNRYMYLGYIWAKRI